MLPPVTFTLLVSILLLALCVHTLGIYLCYKEETALQKQKILLVNLSCVEILTIVYMIVHLCGGYMNLTREDLKTANKIFCTAYHCITSLFYCSMILISADRLMCIVTPAKYYVYVHKSTLKKVVFGLLRCPSRLRAFGWATFVRYIMAEAFYHIVPLRGVQ